MTEALQMFRKATELLRATEMLHRSHQDHAAYVCASHAGINAADAIGLYESDPYRGTNHRDAGAHLRQLDVTLAKPAQALNRLADSKSSVEYRELRFTRNQVADAVGDATVLVRAASQWIGADFDEDRPVAIGQLRELVKAIERESQREGLDLGKPPWSTTIAILNSLSNKGTTIDELLSSS